MGAHSKLKVIEFFLHNTVFDDVGLTTTYLFYDERGYWDECKLTLDEALLKYPLDEFKWVYGDE